MSEGGTRTVTLYPADEVCEPPGEVVEISVTSGRVFISVRDYAYDAQSKTSSYTVKDQIPEIFLADLLRALAAFADVQPVIVGLTKVGK